MSKRCFDIILSGGIILLLSPFLLLIGLLVKLGDFGPVFYCQERVGLHGRLFLIRKFRTMYVGADKDGPCVTKSADRRVTRLGVYLRKWKMDELPQLFNVFCGEMSLVGPRPEVARYVKMYTPDQRRVLGVRPGITDLASIEFRNEEDMLSKAADLEQFYINNCMPRKLELNMRYASDASIFSDCIIILKTVFAIFFRCRR